MAIIERRAEHYMSGIPRLWRPQMMEVCVRIVDDLISAEKAIVQIAKEAVEQSKDSGHD